MCYPGMSDEGGGIKSKLGGLAQKVREHVKVMTQRSGAPEGEAAPSTAGSFFKRLGASARMFDPAAASDMASKFFQNQRNWGFYGKFATIVLSAYFAADLSAILAGKMLPEAPVSHARGGFGFHRTHQLDDYNIVMSRNLFNENGVIPGEETENVFNTGGTPVRTTLPFELIGTMIFEDENHSIATIQDKSANQVYPVRIQDEIPGKAKIMKIEARKVVFVNEQNHHPEFIDMPEEAQPSHVSVASNHSSPDSGINRVAANQFVISHSEVEKALSDLNNILTQARAVPNFENGQPAGYKLFQIVPGSIYQKLGIQEGDVITGFDGQPANDPAAAFEKLSNLKNTSHLDLQIKRGGQLQTFSYDFR